MGGRKKRAIGLGKTSKEIKRKKSTKEVKITKKKERERERDMGDEKNE